MQKRKLGSDDLISTFNHRIENATKVQFLEFEQGNNEKRKVFIVSFQNYFDQIYLHSH